MVAAVYRRSDFLSRLLLVAAHAAQGSTSNMDGAANMTKDNFFDDVSDREKRRDRISNFVIDSGLLFTVLMIFRSLTRSMRIIRE